MNKEQLQAEVRKIAAKAGKRRIWQRAIETLLALSKEFGKEESHQHNDYTDSTRELVIRVESGWVFLKMWNSGYGPTNIEIFFKVGTNLPDLVFAAHASCDSDYREAKEKGLDFQFAYDNKYGWVVIKAYNLGVWEKAIDKRVARAALLA